MEIENEDLSKKIEDINVPNLETPKHRALLRAALLGSDRFQEKRPPFWIGKMATVGLSGAFILLIFLGSEELFSNVLNNKNVLDPKKIIESVPQYSAKPEENINNGVSDNSVETPINSEEQEKNNYPSASDVSDPVPDDSSVSEMENGQIIESATEKWNDYQNKGYGYDIRLPQNWSFGAVKQADGLGGLSNKEAMESWTISPAPVFEVTPEKDPDLVWLAKDEKGDIKLEINTESKAKWNGVSLKQFASDYPTPKDKIIILASTDINLGNNEAVKQDMRITDPEYSGSWYYISSDNYFYIIRTKGDIDPIVIDRIIATIKFTE